MPQNLNEYKNLVRFGCNETCFESCKNNGQFRPYGIKYENHWITQYWDYIRWDTDKTLQIMCNKGLEISNE